MCVGARDAEGGDGGPAGTPRFGPGTGFGDQFHGARGPVDACGGDTYVQGGRDHACGHGLHHFDDACHTCGCLGVSDVGLDRAQQQWPVRWALLPVDRQQRLRLDRIAE